MAYLWRLARELPDPPGPPVSVGFVEEFVHLFRGAAGRSGMYSNDDGTPLSVPSFLQYEGRQAALARSELLDRLAERMSEHLRKYPSGLDAGVVARRQANRKRVLTYFRASAQDWNDWRWQIRHVVREPDVLFDLVELDEAQRATLRKAYRNHIPFGVTPYYLSLMDPTPGDGADHAIRAQVIPPAQYVDEMVARRFDDPSALDFMGESDTSPVELVTRRYPMVAILKPFHTCAQICVYCQRNWELRECLAPNALASRETLDSALAWFEQHPSVGDVLITGGDPVVLADESLEPILARVAAMPHVYRIRLGTRTPVVLPSRWTESLVDLLASYQAPGRREVAVVTHFEHAYEVTPEAAAAVHRLARRGIRVYNQEVFTLENSRRFETAKLRLAVRSIGVDPYHTFAMKGKAETRQYMAPIARILQERKEEARLLPGLDRTDEPVFNVPRLGKKPPARVAGPPSGDDSAGRRPCLRVPSLGKEPRDRAPLLLRRCAPLGLPPRARRQRRGPARLPQHLVLFVSPLHHRTSRGADTADGLMHPRAPSRRDGRCRDHVPITTTTPPDMPGI